VAESELQIGGRIKRLRRQKKMSQTDLAQLLDISPSYLNLIEHNRRRITVSLLLKIAAAFGVEAGELADSEEPRLAGDLMELFGDDLFADSDVTNQDIRDLATSNPAIGRAVIRLYDKYRAVRTVNGTTVAATEAGYHLATDAVSDFLQANVNHFPTLETAADRMRADIDLASESFEHGLKTYLLNVFGLVWKSAALPGGVSRRFDAERGEIVTADLLPPESGVFAVAQQLGILGAIGEIDRLIADSSLPADAPVIARNALAAYFAAALIMPYEPFLRACKETRYDIERIARRFNASFEQVCHRMTTLQRPGRSGIPLHLIRTDIAGNISKRFSLSGIHIPRHSGACPRWNVYAAFLHPEEINVQISQMPEGQRYFCIARSITKGGHRHNAPRRHLSIGLGCHIGYAAELVYSDGLDVTNPDLAVPIGVGCRSCPRLDCGQRAHPPSDHRFSVDESGRAENFYVRP
jgi:predicted transcriptional regulator/DNA-binding XRE family transcriptional regulator